MHIVLKNMISLATYLEMCNAGVTCVVNPTVYTNMWDV